MAESNQEKILKLKRLPEVLDQSERILRRIGMAFRTFTRERTQQGKDVEGNTFRPYSEPYKGIRRKLRRPVHPVDLTIDDFQGMIARIDHRIDNNLNHVEMYINDDEKALIGRYHAVDGAGKNKIIRKWWGLSSEHEERLVKVLNLEIDKLIESEL